MKTYIILVAFSVALFSGCNPQTLDPTNANAEVESAPLTMEQPVYEVAVRKVKAGQLEAFVDARSNFISILKEVDGAEVDREFESFFALPEPDDTEVFIGMTRWRSPMAAQNAGEMLMKTPEAGAFFSTLDFKAYVMVRPIEGPKFDLSTIATQEGHVLEIGVRKVKAGMEAEFERTRKAFIELLEQQEGTLESWEFEVVGGQNTEGLTVGMTTYESREAFMKVVEAVMPNPITQEYFATFVPQAAQVSFSTTND